MGWAGAAAMLALGGSERGLMSAQNGGARFDLQRGWIAGWLVSTGREGAGSWQQREAENYPF